MKKKPYAIILILFALLVYLHTLVGIPYGPMHGLGDQGGWEAVGFYVYEHFHLFPFPHLNFATNSHFYPLGISAVYHSWAVERDLFYALGQTVFGQGSWLAWYYILSQIILVFGIFSLLRRRIGDLPSSFLSICVLCFNGYALHKFPEHYGIGIYHWVALSVLIDSLLSYDSFNKGKIDPKLLLLRALTGVGSFGHELGYVAGINISSFAITCPFVIGVLIVNNFGHCKAFLKNFGYTLQADFKAHRRFYVATGVLLICISCIYLGTFFSIFIEIKKQQTPEVLAAMKYWADPARFFAPLVEPYYGRAVSNLKDNAESFLGGSPGWTFLFLGIVGILSSLIARSISFVPVFLLLVFYVTYAPQSTSWSGHIPWMSYARVGTRFTLVYPILLVCIAWATFLPSRFSKKIVAIKYAFVVTTTLLLAYLEYPMIYFQRTSPTSFQKLPEDFVDHMEKLSRARGEAVLDWPFVFMGGNGNGYWPAWELVGIWSNRKYHHKKVLGTYFARLSEKQSGFYGPYGIDKLVRKQKNECLNSEELAYLKAFYEYYDFAGIQFYKNYIPAQCMDALNKTFSPIIRTLNFPGTGIVSYSEKQADDNSPRIKGDSSNQFYESRYVVIKAIAVDEMRRGSIYLPESQKLIYSYLIETFARDVKGSVQWYTDIDLENIKESKSIIVVEGPYRAGSDRSILVKSETTSAYLIN